MAEEFLEMTFDPLTIEDLSSGTYLKLPNMLAELISNAYDAEAEEIKIILDDKNGEKKIIVEDDGVGMLFNELNNKFLKIGRKRRKEDGQDVTKNKKRKIIGKKGLGKLAFFGIAHEIEVETKRDSKVNTFRISWDDMQDSLEANYRPEIIEHDGVCKANDHGTKITLTKIKRKSDFKPEELANSLSKIFTFESDFRVEIIHNSEPSITISNQMRFDNLDSELEWDIPNDYEYNGDYDKATQITGKLITTKNPLSPNTNMRGITLFSRNKMVNKPEYFSDSTSSHFFSYLTGWLNVDFIDDFEEDLISVDRTSLKWEHEELEKLQDYLGGLIGWLEGDWREKRNKKREGELKDKTGIDIPGWLQKTPDNVSRKLLGVLETVTEDSELSDNKRNETIENIHDLLPEYTYYHWRFLHQKVQDTAGDYYKKEDYFAAVFEAVKAYISEVRKKSGNKQESEYSLMQKVFGAENSSTLQIAQNFLRSDGEEFHEDTISNIENGHKDLSAGVVSSCRNPLGHAEHIELNKSSLFTEKDCLDMLSLLSHLFTRLDNAEKV